MAIPPGAAAWSRVLDPADLQDLRIDLRTPGKTALQDGEAIKEYTLILYPDAAFVGFNIEADGLYAPSNTADSITFWASVDPAMREDPMFQGAGVTVGMELTVTTTSTPSRRFQRTLKIGVAQQ